MKLNSTNKQYISYGKSKFDPEKINTSEFSSTLLNKPDGCFWASPVDAKYGWAAWATFNLPEYEDGVDKMDYIKFDLKNAQIYKVETLKDVLELPYVDAKPGEPRYFAHIDYEVLRSKGYDGVELSMKNYRIGKIKGNIENAKPLAKEDENLTDEEIKTALHMENMFEFWDCESIVIWNPDVINVIEEKHFAPEEEQHRPNVMTDTIQGIQAKKAFENSQNDDHFMENDVTRF